MGSTSRRKRCGCGDGEGDESKANANNPVWFEWIWFLFWAPAANEGGMLLHPARLLHQSPNCSGRLHVPSSHLRIVFFWEGGGGRGQGAGEDLSWERCDMVKPSPAPKGCAPGTPPARRASHPISSQHHLLPPAFLGRFAHRGPVRLSISLFGARMNIY